jgi:hypothetical protein
MPGWFPTPLVPVTVWVVDPVTVIVRPCAFDAFQPLMLPLNWTQTAPSELKLPTPVPPHVAVNTVAPAAQPPPVHNPLTHERDPHEFAHEPQLLASVCSLTHAPLQSEKPVLQEKVHVPPEHVAVAFATLVVQAVGELQAPPLHVSTPLPLSTPFPLQSVCPGAHTPVQAPFTHVWLVHAAAEPQVPFDWHVWTPLPEHCVVAGTQTPVHAPFTQAELVHAAAALHVAFAWHVSTPLPLQVLWPCAHTPLHPPLRHV